ncbi:hypothetical protein AX17_005426 [Amanita inopinata Kibby_2008]|nr:hypothetical protein AX17_005426 [Amanita inopinata Kibby_2008]
MVTVPVTTLAGPVPPSCKLPSSLMLSRRGSRWYCNCVKLLVIFLVLLSESASWCHAALKNRTIDDTLGDEVTHVRPVFLPTTPGVWEDETCKGCAVQPDRNLAHDGTWTAATYNPTLQNISITLEFSGVAIYVFFILANANMEGPTITTNTECNFTLDGQHAGAFSHFPNMNTYDLVYNANPFSATGLSNTAHQLVISTNGVDHNVFVNFDYAIYTVETQDGSLTSPSTPTLMPPLAGVPASSFVSSLAASLEPSVASQSLSPSTSSPSSNSLPKTTTPSSGHVVHHPIAIIVGLTVGGVALIVLILLLLGLYSRRRSRDREMAMAMAMATPLPPAPHAIGFNGTPMAAYQDESVSHPLLWRDATTHTSDQSRLSTSLSYRRSLPSGAMSNDQTLSTLDYTDLSSTQGSLIPLRRDAPRRGSVSSSKTREEVRAMRQMEIDQRLQSAQREMNNLTVRQSLRLSPNSPASQGAGGGRGSAGGAEAGEEMEVLREQVRSLNAQIDHLRVQQQSDWALGLSDEPPPAYSVTS